MELSSLSYLGFYQIKINIVWFTCLVKFLEFKDIMPTFKIILIFDGN